MTFRKTIAAVSYLNTIPFIYGIKHRGNDLCAELLLSPPAGCSTLFNDKKCDVALMPIVAALQLPQDQIRIIDGFCIGVSSKVRTVTLLSNTPVDQLTKIYLDRHSQTSVVLIQILAKELWNISVEWEFIEDYSSINPKQAGCGWLLIGDKVFDNEHLFSFNYDLAEAWQRLTSLPFAFALWVARKETPDSYIEALEQALRYGVENIDAAIAESKYSEVEYAHDYLTNNIDFIFDSRKHEALELFREKSMRLKRLIINPG